MSRFTVGKKELVIGFFCDTEEKPFHQYHSLASCLINVFMNDIDINEIQFQIKELDVLAEHDVDVEYSDNKAKGYTGHIEGYSSDLHFTNQYPTASYGQIDTTSDNYWGANIKPEIKDQDNKAGGYIKGFKDNKQCYRFAKASYVLDELFDAIRNRPVVAVLYNKLSEVLKTDFPQWNIIYAPIHEDVDYTLSGHIVEHKG